MSIFDHYTSRFEKSREEELSLQEYLELCKKDPLTKLRSLRQGLEIKIGRQLFGC